MMTQGEGLRLQMPAGTGSALTHHLQPTFDLGSEVGPEKSSKADVCL